MGAKQFVFPGDSRVIALKRDVAYFITMNPGYQGRQELPENLKVGYKLDCVRIGRPYIDCNNPVVTHRIIVLYARSEWNH